MMSLPIPKMLDLNDVRYTLVVHRELVKRALEITSDFPWRGDSGWDADEDGAPVLTVESDGVAILTWRKVGYDGGSFYDSGSWLEEVRFPAELLLLSADDLRARREQAKREEEAQQIRVSEKAAKDAARRQEALDRREYERLIRKFGAPK